MFTIGNGFTFTIAISFPTHPFWSVPLTVNVDVVIGNACTEEVIAELNPNAGLQEYEFAPLAFRVTESPKHIAVVFGFTLMFGNGFTFTFIDELSEHPLLNKTKSS